MTNYRFEISENIATITFDMAGKVNVMTDAFIADMEAIMDRLQRDRATLAGVILTSAKESFFAGGDLALMGRARPGQEALLEAHFQRLKAPFRALERLGIPVVAALNGSALGGGYELALACHRRIALRTPRLVIGLPEVCFGILPGAGGAVRLTRLLGLHKALDYLLSGRKADVEQALRDGLIDAIADTPEDLHAQARCWIRSNPNPVQPWDCTEDGANVPVAAWGDRSSSALQERAVRSIAALAAGSLALDVDKAFDRETQTLVELMVTPEASELISRFFSTRRATAVT